LLRSGRGDFESELEGKVIDALPRAKKEVQAGGSDDAKTPRRSINRALSAGCGPQRFEPPATSISNINHQHRQSDSPKSNRNSQSCLSQR